MRAGPGPAAAARPGDSAPLTAAVHESRSPMTSRARRRRARGTVASRVMCAPPPLARTPGTGFVCALATPRATAPAGYADSPAKRRQLQGQHTSDHWGRQRGPAPAPRGRTPSEISDVCRLEAALGLAD